MQTARIERLPCDSLECSRDLITITFEIDSFSIKVCEICPWLLRNVAKTFLVAYRPRVTIDSASLTSYERTSMSAMPKSCRRAECFSV